MTMVNNNTILNVEGGRNSQSLPPPLAHQYTRQNCQVSIRCSPCSSIDIDCIHLFSKSSSFFSSFMYDSESFVETDWMNSLPGFLKIFSDLHLVFDAYPVFKPSLFLTGRQRECCMIISGADAAAMLEGPEFSLSSWCRHVVQG